MNKLLAILVILVVLPVSAEAGFQYLVFRGGPGWASDVNRVPNPNDAGSVISFKSEFDLNIAYGRSFTDWLRTEVELGYVYMDFEKMYLKNQGETVELEGDDTHLRVLSNFYLDWNTGAGLTPFIGGGFGLAHANLDMKWEHQNGSTAETESSDNTFIWQAVAGTGWSIGSSWELELMYRFYASNDLTHDNHENANYPEVEVEGTKGSFIELGIRYLIQGRSPQRQERSYI